MINIPENLVENMFKLVAVNALYACSLVEGLILHAPDAHVFFCVHLAYLSNQDLLAVDRNIVQIITPPTNFCHYYTSPSPLWRLDRQPFLSAPLPVPSLIFIDD